MGSHPAPPEAEAVWSFCLKEAPLRRVWPFDDADALRDADLPPFDPRKRELTFDPLIECAPWASLKLLELPEREVERRETAEREPKLGE